MMLTISSQRGILMSTEEHEKISALLENHAMLGATERHLLSWKVDVAILLKPANMLPDVVTVDSRVNYLNVNDASQYWARLRYPGEVNDNASVSLFSTLGAALIGLSVGQEFHWCGLNGRRGGIRVLQVGRSGAITPNQCDAIHETGVIDLIGGERWATKRGRSRPGY